MITNFIHGIDKDYYGESGYSQNGGLRNVTPKTARELRYTGYTVYYTHREILHDSGTVPIDIHYSVAFCSPKDMFSKKVGRAVAVEKFTSGNTKQITIVKVDTSNKAGWQLQNALVRIAILSDIIDVNCQDKSHYLDNYRFYDLLFNRIILNQNFVQKLLFV